MFSLLVAAPLAFALPDTEVVEPPTAANGIDYQLYLHVPPACRTPEAACPAVYLLDAEYSFPLAASIATHLAERRRMPWVITVSIGYQDKTQYRPNRTRDYTPFPVNAEDGGPNQRGSGGGAAFRAVIRDEIIPFVEARYHPDPQQRTLVGHSYGGLFAVNTLLEEPDLFDNFIIVSPSLWYGGGHVLEQARQAPSRQKIGSMRVYLAVGEWEEQPENGRAMVSEARQLDRMFAAWGDAVIAHEIAVLPEESHASVFPAALSNGLRKLFGVAFNGE